MPDLQGDTQWETARDDLITLGVPHAKVDAAMTQAVDYGVADVSRLDGSGITVRYRIHYQWAGFGESYGKTSFEELTP